MIGDTISDSDTAISIISNTAEPITYICSNEFTVYYEDMIRELRLSFQPDWKYGKPEYPVKSNYCSHVNPPSITLFRRMPDSRSGWKGTRRLKREGRM